MFIVRAASSVSARLLAVLAATACGDNEPGSRSVLELHGSPTRAGAYVEAVFTRAAAAGMHLDVSFQTSYAGAAFAQPLHLDRGGQ
jgi:hypothetical protein